MLSDTAKNRMASHSLDTKQESIAIERASSMIDEIASFFTLGNFNEALIKQVSAAVLGLVLSLC